MQPDLNAIPSSVNFSDLTATPSTVNFSVMIVSHFELGLDYFDYPLFTYSSKWNCDNYNITVDWTDGLGRHGPPKNNVEYAFDPAKKDRYAINGQWQFWDHPQFGALGQYQAAITAILHQVDSAGGSITFPEVHSVQVWPRISVDKISADSLRVPGGRANLSGTIILDAPAPPSGTRVLLQVVGLAPDGTPDPSIVLPIVQQTYPVSPLNSFTVIVQPPDRTVGTFTIATTLPTSNVKMIVIASTIGLPRQTATITVTP
jgi:hypothetical protein